MKITNDYKDFFTKQYIQVTDDYSGKTFIGTLQKLCDICHDANYQTLAYIMYSLNLQSVEFYNENGFNRWEFLYKQPKRHWKVIKYNKVHF